MTFQSFMLTVASLITVALVATGTGTAVSNLTVMV